MLSFDFLTDEVVMVLPPVGVMLLAGMVARSDNLGRIPGDPGVLLAYLFHPRPPRSDVSTDDISKLLEVLATRGIVEWYRVRGIAVAQFSEWKRHQSGLKPHLLKSQLPAPDDPDAKRVIEIGGQESLWSEPVPVSASVDVVALVRAVADQASLDGRFDEPRVWAWIKEHGGLDGRGPEWIKFSRWLFNSGVTAMGDVMHLLDLTLEARPQNAYAYWNGEHRTEALRRHNLALSECESDAHKKAEREFVSKAAL